MWLLLWERIEILILCFYGRTFSYKRTLIHLGERVGPLGAVVSWLSIMTVYFRAKLSTWRVYGLGGTSWDGFDGFVWVYQQFGSLGLLVRCACAHGW